MGADSLGRFLDSLRQLGSSATEVDVRRSITAARIAWASIYDMILLAGGVGTNDLEAFAGALDRFADTLSTSKSERAPAYRCQVAWYRKLLDLYRDRGMFGVNEVYRQPDRSHFGTIDEGRQRLQSGRDRTKRPETGNRMENVAE